MEQEKVNKAIDNFLKNKTTKKITDEKYEECDLETGECHVITSKDGIVERINKKFITEDGRQLLSD
jgi:predicted RNA binding protein with dsRBD fold (UPF0201 family)